MFVVGVFMFMNFDQHMSCYVSDKFRLVACLQEAHHSFIDDSEVIVDYNRQQLMPGWIPRRLGQLNILILLISSRGYIDQSQVIFVVFTRRGSWWQEGIWTTSFWRT